MPIRLRDCDRGDLQLISFQRYDLFPDFETGLDRLAVHLGGISLSDAQAEDERTEEEKLIAALLGKAEAAYYALDYNKAISVWNSVLSINPGDAQAWNNKGSALYNLGRHQDALDAYPKFMPSKI